VDHQGAAHVHPAIPGSLGHLDVLNTQCLQHRSDQMLELERI
jgi:hypothetical protein